jgi:hypothetical protein
MPCLKIKYGHTILTPGDSALGFKATTTVSKPDLLTKGDRNLLFAIFFPNNER